MQIKAKVLARILGGHPAGRGFLCHCPVASHGKGRGDLRPSLAVCDGDRALIYNCFAGCDPRDVRAAIDKLDVNRTSRFEASPALARAKRKTTTADALDLWRTAQPIAGTPVETYFHARGFEEPPPATIRFLPRYPYSSRKSFACMISAVQAPTREIVAVQLTFLHSGGQRKADVLEPRRAIGPLGAGALRLAPVAEHIGLAEGFETAWAAQLVYDMPVWAALGNKRYLKVLFPAEVKRVTIFADDDAPGLLYAEKFREERPALGVAITTPGGGSNDFSQLWQREGGGAKATRDLTVVR
jgi:putative DNA primase/helicase